MNFLSTKSLLISVVLVALLSEALGHSYLTNPTSRSNQKETTTGCRGPACLGPCDRPRAAATRAPISIQRGASISVQWPRNNHAGGFIRLAWAPTSNSDSHAAFDAGVQQINCHEVGGCHPDNAADPNGGDSGPADGSSRACAVTITVPKHLTNGAWTLQWVWFGGAFALGDYYSCTDYTITGGPSAVAEAPVFKGGDFSYPNQQKCKYFNTDRPHRCVNEPCNNPVYTLNAERSGTPFFSAAVAPVPNPVPNPPPSVPNPPPSVPNPPPSVPNPSPPASNPSTPSGAACTIGHMRCTGASSFETCSPSRTSSYWAGPQNCAAGLFCNPSGNFIFCGYTAGSNPSPPASNPTPPASNPTPPANNPSPPANNPPSSSSCSTLGNQQCVGTSQFKTCGHGANGGNAWSVAQSCQAGLSCHPSSTGNNIYCY